MFASTEHNRKRPRRDDSNHENQNQNARAAATKSVAAAGIENMDQSNNAAWPVVCLTGFSPKEKDHYHKLIENLGGR
jgi:hypothetical protein